MGTFYLKGIDQALVFELESGLNRVGRNPTNDIRIPDSTVSSFHCELIVSEDSVTVSDLQSTNGTYLDGEAVREGVLKAGQVLRLGQVGFRLETEVPVVIAIPDLKPPPALPVQTHLLDGGLACLNHPGVRATSRCQQCGQAYCGECARPVGLKGGTPRSFCPACSGLCELLPTEPAGKKKKGSLLDRLTKTIRIALRK